MSEKSLKDLNGLVNYRSRPMTVIIGVVIILMGVFSLLSTTLGFEAFNWWLFGLLIPIAFLAMSFVNDLRNGAFSLGPIIGILSLILLYCVFAFGWSWSIVAPIYIIFGGLFVLETVWK